MKQSVYGKLSDLMSQMTEDNYHDFIEWRSYGVDEHPLPVRLTEKGALALLQRQQLLTCRLCQGIQTRAKAAREDDAFVVVTRVGHREVLAALSPRRC